MYRVIVANLTEDHTDYPILNENKEYYELIVLKADDECFIRINDTSNDKIRCYQNLKIKGIPIRRIFLTNPASSVSGARLEILLLGGEG